MHSETKSFYPFVAVLLHPIFYPLLATIFFLYFTPRYLKSDFQVYILVAVFIGTILFPLVFLFVLKYAKIITSFLLKVPQERKYPFAIFTILALLMSRIFFKIESTYGLGVYFMAGSIAFLIGYWFLLSGEKISLHTMGIGSFIGFVIEMSWVYQINYLTLLILSFVLFGVVAHNRITLKAHTFRETMYGFIIGFLPQLLIPLIYQNI